MIHELLDSDQIDNAEELRLQGLTAQAAAELAALLAERDAWKNFAEHQMSCALCADNCYDCESGVELMIAICKINSAYVSVLDSEEIAAALALDR